MMQKIQKFGGAMFMPVLLFAFAGVVIGLGTLSTPRSSSAHWRLPIRCGTAFGT